MSSKVCEFVVGALAVIAVIVALEASGIGPATRQEVEDFGGRCRQASWWPVAQSSEADPGKEPVRDQASPAALPAPVPARQKTPEDLCWDAQQKICELWGRCGALQRKYEDMQGHLRILAYRRENLRELLKQAAEGTEEHDRLTRLCQAAQVYETAARNRAAQIKRRGDELKIMAELLGARLETARTVLEAAQGAPELRKAIDAVRKIEEDAP